MTGTTYVPKLPDCDIHAHRFGLPGIPAAYDAVTITGQWANMCDPCWRLNALSFTTGTGKGQKYVLGEPPERDRNAEAQAALESGDVDAFFDACGDGDPLDFL